MDIVDLNDSIIGQADFDDVYASIKTKNPMIFRSVAIFVLNSENRLLIQKRSSSVKVSPRLWDSSAAGHIDVGESYLEAAIKELSEELGIKAKKKDLIFVGKLAPNKNLISFSVLYLINYNGPIKTNEEVEKIKFISINEVKKDIKKNPKKYSEHFKIIFNLFIKGYHGKGKNKKNMS